MLPGQGNPIDDLMKSLADMNTAEGAELKPKFSKGEDLTNLLRDHAYGLLKEEYLTPAQVEFLSIILKALTARN